MSAHSYTMNIFWSHEDAVYVVEVPDLPGCTAHGETASIAVANANDAIDFWIETARADGIPVPPARGRERLPA